MTDNQLKELLEELDEITPGGGPLHIVVDDCNVADDHVEWCHMIACEGGFDHLGRRISYSKEECELSRRVAAALYRRTPDERRRLLSFDEWYRVDEDGENIYENGVKVRP